MEHQTSSNILVSFLAAHTYLSPGCPLYLRLKPSRTVSVLLWRAPCRTSEPAKLSLRRSTSMEQTRCYGLSAVCMLACSLKTNLEEDHFHCIPLCSYN